MNQRFSIITCTKNSAEYLQNNIDSVKKQTFTDYEHIFIDGFSIDKTKEIIHKYKKSDPDKIKLFFTKPRGISDAMNNGIIKAKGEYLIFLHSDDCFHDHNVLSDVSAYLTNNPYDWVFGKEELVNRSYEHIGFKSYSFLVRQKSNFIGKIIMTYLHIVRHQSTFIKKTVFERLGYFDTNLNCPMDLDMWLRIKDSTNWSHLDRIISNFMVRHDSVSFSTDQTNQAFSEIYNVYNKHLNFHQKILKLFLEAFYALFFATTNTKKTFSSIYRIFFMSHKKDRDGIIRQNRRKIYIDCSRVYVFGGNHGIPRVVRNIVNEVLNSHSDEVIPIVFSFGKFRAIKRIPHKSERLLKILKKVKSIIFSKRTKPQTQNGVNNKKARSIAYNLSAFPTIFGERITPSGGDVLITTDNFLMSAFPNDISKLKNRGVIIGSILYDLIPLRNGNFYPNEEVVGFTNHLNNLIRLSNFCLTISNYVKEDLIKYMREMGVQNNIKIESFKLGHDLDNIHYDNKVSEILSNVFDKSTYIIVSTIEPRKNHTYALDAFEKVWQQGIKSNLVIIGKIGWMCDEITMRIKNHKQYGKRLFMFNNVSDTELNYCYKKSKALITPSIVEGFGLPIVEALAHKTPVLASDIPVFREVGGNFCSYFDLKDSDSLANIIIKWERAGQEPIHRSLEEFSWPTWKESTADLIQKIIMLAEQK